MKFAALAGALLSLAVPAVAQAETLTLDISKTHQPKAQFKAWGTWSIVEVQGTGSFHYSSVWSNPQRIFKNAAKTTTERNAVICGTPEAEPMFPSPGVKNGKVGFDAETLFARPVAEDVCADWPAPMTTRRFEIHDGERWFHPTTLLGRYTSPRADHTYTYALFGEDARPVFRVRDEPTYDNYGRFKIHIRQAYSSDCLNRQWRNFLYGYGGDGFTCEAACVAALPAPPHAT